LPQPVIIRFQMKDFFDAVHLGQYRHSQVLLTLHLSCRHDILHWYACAQKLSERQLLSAEEKLRSVVAYHMLPRPLAYADLGRARKECCVV
jgi:hypothetical protein